MIENCHQDYNIEINFNKVPCCLNHLLIMNKMSEEFLLSHEFGKFLLKIFKNIFEKEKNIIKNNIKLNENISKDFILMISKHMSHFYFTSKIKFAKYLCKILFNLYIKQGYNDNESKLKDITSIKNNLSCIYYKEKRYDKAFSIIKDIYDSNISNNSNDTLIYLNNYINLYIKSKNRITKDFYNKINLLKNTIKQKINQILQMTKMYDNNIFNKKKNNNNNYTISEIQLYLFIYYNYCNIYTNFKNNHSQSLSNYKIGYELSLYYFGENHYIAIKYKNIINKSLFSKINISKGYKYRNHKENKKIFLTKYEINSKLDEISIRLEKIGKSFFPVKKVISNYVMEEKINQNNNINNNNDFKRNKSKIQIYADDISKEEDYPNNFDNKFLKNMNSDYNNFNKIDEDNNSIKKSDDLPKIVINLNNENNDNLVCTTLYQETSDFETEENENKNNKNIPKIVINLDNHNNDDFECETLFQQAPGYGNENKNEKGEEEIYNNKENFKNIIPKINVCLDKTNNDDYTCETFFLSADEGKDNENDNFNKGDLDLKGYSNNKENSKNNIPKINLCLDQSNNDDYICETFFLSADEGKDNEKDNFNKNKIINNGIKNNESKDNSNKYKFSFNIIKSEDNQNNIQNNIFEDENKIEKKEINIKTKNEEILNNYFIDIKFYRPLEIKTNKNETIFDITEFINNIKDKKCYNNEYKYDYKIRILNNKKYLLKLEMSSNDSVKICLVDKENNDELFSSQYSYNKLLNVYKIIRYDLCLNNMQSYYNYNSYDEFITKTFLNFITINKEKGSFKFKMAKKPLGLCYCNIVIQLHFCKCIFDLVVISQNYCKIIFSSENDDFNSISIETYFDDESFNMLIDTELLDNNKYVYSFKNNDLNNNELLMELIKKIQKCINSYCSGVVNVFDDIYSKTNPNQKKLKEILIFKLEITHKLNDMKLFVCEFGNRLCKVVSVDQNLIKQKGIIYSCEINDLFGYETGEIWIKLFTFQKVIFGQLILNSIFYNKSNSRICLNKYELLDEYNFVQELKLSNFSLIKLNEKIFYIKFTIYMSIGPWEYTKIIFINSKNNNINKIKLKSIKEKLFDEFKIVNQSFNKGEDSYFAYINLD